VTVTETDFVASSTSVEVVPRFTSKHVYALAVVYINQVSMLNRISFIYFRLTNTLKTHRML
jgi:hypothetical protein